jgi:hypothetical protein
MAKRSFRSLQPIVTPEAKPTICHSVVSVSVSETRMNHAHAFVTPASKVVSLSRNLIFAYFTDAF